MNKNKTNDESVSTHTDTWITNGGNNFLILIYYIVQ